MIFIIFLISNIQVSTLLNNNSNQNFVHLNQNFVHLRSDLNLLEIINLDLSPRSVLGITVFLLSSTSLLLFNIMRDVLNNDAAHHIVLQLSNNDIVNLDNVDMDVLISFFTNIREIWNNGLEEINTIINRLSNRIEGLTNYSRLESIHIALSATAEILYNKFNFLSQLKNQLSLLPGSENLVTILDNMLQPLLPIGKKLVYLIRSIEIRMVFINPNVDVLFLSELPNFEPREEQVLFIIESAREAIFG